MESDRELPWIDSKTLRLQERLLPSLIEAGLSEQQARAQINRLAAGDVWGG